ncbi:hypothetical protein GOP47_0016338 [Adiantum capillus-veneris]|uniref:TLC domain-containing protein n=1 Tax=Adiantum capillus-veneris TaxID=13818 RepID=A0A9D4UHF8_ADICA|nr:hypothetical protein GOP47_0016338 [Adiantum capillus-veneris]
MMTPQTLHSQLLSLVSGYPRAEQPTLWFSSVILGILACKTVYNVMKVVSPLFPPYTRLSKSQKIEWDNRGFSTAHAIAISAASAYFVFISDLFKDDAPYGPIVFRNSVSSQVVLGISGGYFISDLAMILWFYPNLGGKEYVIHHLLSMLSLNLSFFNGEGSFYVYMVLLSEVTTPFVNMRWYLSSAGMKKSKAYAINGVLLFFGWMIARVLLFMYLIIHLYVHFDQVRQLSKGSYYCVLIVPPCLASMNIVWFFKVAKGMLKTLSKRA